MTKQHRVFTPEEVQQMITLRDQEYTAFEISNLMNCGANQVRHQFVQLIKKGVIKPMTNKNRRQKTNFKKLTKMQSNNWVNVRQEPSNIGKKIKNATKKTQTQKYNFGGFRPVIESDPTPEFVYGRQDPQTDTVVELPKRNQGFVFNTSKCLEYIFKD